MVAIFTSWQRHIQGIYLTGSRGLLETPTTQASTLTAAHATTLQQTILSPLVHTATALCD